MKSPIQIRRTTAVLTLLVALLAGALVTTLALRPSAQPLVPIARAASLEPGALVTFAPVVKEATPAVVTISSTKVIKASQQQRDNPMFNDPFFRQFFGDQFRGMQQPRDRRESGLGSGVIVNPDGYILTNNHVVNGATTVKVQLSDRREFNAKIVGTDPQSDLAVVKIDAKNLPSLPFSDSSKAHVGDICLAIGNPYGIGKTVTMGIISATGRGNLGIENFEDFIQTDASINPGNSGGALINTRGELLGINTAILPSGGGGNQGIGFAIPINMARNVMDQIMKSGKVTRGYIGAYLQPVDAALAKAFGLPNADGVAITKIDPKGPASSAGLKEGDVITQVNDSPVVDVNSLRNQISGFAPGTTVHFKVIRDSKPLNLSATLAARPSERDGEESEQGSGGEHKRGALEGVSVDTLTPEIAQQIGVPPSTKGVVISDIDDGSPAAEAGLKRGDVIQEVNRKPVATASEFDRLVATGKQSPLLLVNRQGRTLFVVVESK